MQEAQFGMLLQYHYTGVLLGTCAYISTGRKNVFIIQDAPNNETLYMLTYM